MLVWLLGAVSATATGAGVELSTGVRKGEHLTKAPPKFSVQTGPLRIGVAGLVHGHVEGLLHQGMEREDMKIVGVYEPSRELFDKMAQKYKLDPALYFDSLEKMLDAAKPEAVSVMTSIKQHVTVAQACSPRGVHMLFEKPLAFSKVDAERIAAVAAEHGALALTNFETSWYASVRESKRMVEAGEVGSVRRMVFRHGHKGPKEIGCSPEFVAWLTDPVENGGGAITDFGCYGAVLATWMMNGERPTSVVATAGTLKPGMYPRVDDDATIVLTYPTASAVIGASWAWTHDNKEMDIHAERGSIHAAKWDDLWVREPDMAMRKNKPPAKPTGMENEWTYLRRVVRGECAVDPLSSLEMNVVVAEILDAAREGVRKGRGESKK